MKRSIVNRFGADDEPSNTIMAKRLVLESVTNNVLHDSPGVTMKLVAETTPDDLKDDDLPDGAHPRVGQPGLRRDLDAISSEVFCYAEMITDGQVYDPLVFGY